MPSVGYAGKMVLFNAPESKILSGGFFEDARIGKSNFAEPFDISANLTLDLPQNEEICGVLAYSIRTESLVPALKELGFLLREDSHTSPGDETKIVVGLSNAAVGVRHRSTGHHWRARPLSGLRSFVQLQEVTTN